MPALITPGAEVRPYAPGDGTTQIPCPACSHYIPAVAHDALTIGEQRPKAAFIRCACPEGRGTNVIGQRVTCPCHAVFRLHPQGMQRYVVAEGWQEEPKPAEASPYYLSLPVAPEYEVNPDGSVTLIGVSIVGHTPLPIPPVAPTGSHAKASKRRKNT